MAYRWLDSTTIQVDKQDDFCDTILELADKLTKGILVNPYNNPDQLPLFGDENGYQ